MSDNFFFVFLLYDGTIRARFEHFLQKRANKNSQGNQFTNKNLCTNSTLQKKTLYFAMNALQQAHLNIKKTKSKVLSLERLCKFKVW